MSRECQAGAGPPAFDLVAYRDRNMVERACRHCYCGDQPPAEFEAEFYAAQLTDPAGFGNE